MENENKTSLAFTVDFDNFFNFCTLETQKSTNEMHQKEITDSYQLNDDNKMNLSNKIVHEIVTPSESDIHPEKYEVLKMFLSVVLSEEKNDFGEASLAYKLAFNTLVNNKIIK